ncbi:MAG: HAMP domain-containing histidine kinase [Clostridiales bacterium]|nr:HAMP domain-containing histidine kinase [Clostridiales bacterium]
MNRAEKKFRLYAILVIFVLLTVLMAVINGVNFTMASSDADMLTQMIADRQGAFGPIDNNPGGMQFQPDQDNNKDFGMGPMGPDSPEMNESLRYFTVAFSENGESEEIVAFHISAVSEDEAKEWAKELVGQTSGWTKWTYRYRVYRNQGTTYVTVIDQGRELLPSFRILIISVIGEVLVLVIGWFVLLLIGRKIYAPLEEADRKQKNFIANANKEFRVPLTVIDGNTELTERRYGPDDQTRSTHRQVAKMNELVDKLGSVGIFDEENMNRSDISLSEYIKDALRRRSEEFSEKGIALTEDVSEDVKISADPEAMSRLIDELIVNALKFAKTKAEFRLKKENETVLILASNDADLPDGPYEQAFDRFTTLSNAKEGDAGLGLSYVKQTVKAHNGRATASVNSGIFTLRITL